MLENMNRVQKSRTTILILFYLYFVNCHSHVENVALNGTCNMTERFENTGDCTKAIDNVTNLTLGFTSEGKENCIHTSVTSTDKYFPFWQLILNEEYTITNITIYNRVGYKHRLTYTNVTVNGNLCKSFGSDEFTIKDVTTFQCSSPIRGRTVSISRHYPTFNIYEIDDNYTLNVCEVQVWVCSKGWYGHDCNSACSGHCSNNAACDRYDGSCPQGCISGWHGSRCDNSCPQNCVGACNQSSGVCFVCSKGWYGHDCNSACSDHCSNYAACDRYDGSCPQGCISGRHGSRCDNSCPQNCVGACNQSSGVCFAAGQSNSDGLAVGVIVGSVIGIVVVLSAVVLLTLVYRRNSLRKQSTCSSVRPPLDADLTDLQVQYSPGHTEEEIHSQDVQCLNSTYETFDRNALYQNTQELPIYSQLLIDKRNNQ